jgi:hypothetical protein
MDAEIPGFHAARNIRSSADSGDERTQSNLLCAPRLVIVEGLSAAQNGGCLRVRRHAYHGKQPG